MDNPGGAAQVPIDRFLVLIRIKECDGQLNGPMAGRGRKPQTELSEQHLKKQNVIDYNKWNIILILTLFQTPLYLCGKGVLLPLRPCFYSNPGGTNGSTEILNVF